MKKEPQQGPQHLGQRYENVVDLTQFQDISKEKNLQRKCWLAGTPTKTGRLMSKDQDLPLSAYACFYLQLTPRQRKIFQYLRWYQLKYPERAFPGMKKIALFARLSVRAVQKFFAILMKKKIKGFYLTVTPRLNQNGGDSTNLYILNKYFKQAMDWLDIHGFLKSPKKKTKTIILSMQNDEKVHPPQPQKFTPIIKDYSFSKDKHTLGNGVWINPAVKDLRGLDDWAKSYASRYATEFEIQETLEACKYHEKKIKILSPSSYFMRTLKNKMKKRKAT
jgi:hypothetical protein